MSIRFDQELSDAFDEVLPAITKFKAAFGRDISADFLAELYVARKLNLELPDKSNQPGADAIDSKRQKYEIKYRSPNTNNVDLNSFNFDYLILVNLSNDYGLIGMWELPVATAKSLFKYREDFRKYQTTQAIVKRNSKRIK